MVTSDAALLCVIQVLERHRQDRFIASVAKIPDRQFSRYWRTKNDDEYANENNYAERNLHIGRFRTATNSAPNMALTTT